MHDLNCRFDVENPVDKLINYFPLHLHIQLRIDHLNQLMGKYQ